VAGVIGSPREIKMRMPPGNHQRQRPFHFAVILSGAAFFSGAKDLLLPLLQQHRMDMPFQVVHCN